MFNVLWLLELAFVQIVSDICNCPNLMLSAAHVDGCWPLDFALPNCKWDFYSFKSGLSNDYYNRR